MTFVHFNHLELHFFQLNSQVYVLKSQQKNYFTFLFTLQYNMKALHLFFLQKYSVQYLQ